MRITAKDFAELTARKPPRFTELDWVNLTPHPVVVLNGDGSEVARWESAGFLWITYNYDFLPDGTRTAQIADVEGPDGWEGHPQIMVSRTVAMAMLPDYDPETQRVVYPDDEIRDDQGRVVGCRTLTELVP